MVKQPLSHELENEKLVVDGYVDLFEFVLSVDGEVSYLRIKNNNSVEWNGFHWEGVPLMFDGYENSSLTAPKRPQFAVANPNGVFSSYIRDGYLVNATLNRYRVLYTNIIENKPIYQKQKWKVWAPVSFDDKQISLELRTPMDGFNSSIPARVYKPPEFPVVSLK